MVMLDYSVPGWHLKDADWEPRVLCSLKDRELWVVIRLAESPADWEELKEDFRRELGWNTSYLGMALKSLCGQRLVRWWNGKYWLTWAGRRLVRPTLYRTTYIHRLGQQELIDRFMCVESCWVWLDFHSPAAAFKGERETPDGVIIPRLGTDLSHMIAGESERDPIGHKDQMFENLFRNMNDQMPTIFMTPPRHVEKFRKTLDKECPSVELVDSYKDFTNPRQAWITDLGHVHSALDDIRDIKTIYAAIKAIDKGAELKFYKSGGCDFLRAYKSKTGKLEHLGPATVLVRDFVSDMRGRPREWRERLTREWRERLNEIEEGWTPQKIVESIIDAGGKLHIKGNWVLCGTQRVCKVTGAVRAWMFRNPWQGKTTEGEGMKSSLGEKPIGGV